MADRLIRLTHELREELTHQRKLHPSAPEVSLPFSPVFRPDIGQRPSGIQRLLIKWRDRLRERNELLIEHFELQGRELELRRYPLAGWGSEPNFGTMMSADACLRLLGRELRFLALEIQSHTDGEAARETPKAVARVDRGQDGEALLTAGEISQLLGVSKQRVWELMRRGIIEPVKIGRQRRVRRSVLDEFIERGGRAADE